MHQDMAGSAVALGVMLALKEMGAPFQLDCWLALAANDIGPTAVAMSANVASQYGWYQIGGKAVGKALASTDAKAKALAELGVERAQVKARHDVVGGHDGPAIALRCRSGAEREQVTVGQPREHLKVRLRRFARAGLARQGVGEEARVPKRREGFSVVDKERVLVVSDHGDGLSVSDEAARGGAVEVSEQGRVEQAHGSSGK
jgi:hypothetical protein